MAVFEEDYFFNCPYCLASIPLRIDLTGGHKQSFTYDCEVCCRPIAIELSVDEEGVTFFNAEKES